MTLLKINDIKTRRNNTKKYIKMKADLFFKYLKFKYDLKYCNVT